MSSKAMFAPFALLLNLCDGEARGDWDDWPSGDGETASRDGGVETDCAVPPPDAGPARCDGPPGLYQDAYCEVLAEGVRPYRPRFPFFSDGADKERFVYLPKGTKIDASDPDVWVFPKGTRLFKTFSLGGRRLETRIIEKTGDGVGTESWSFVAYAWKEDQTGVEDEIVSPEEGRPDVLGTNHDIPSVHECHRCHERAGQDAINGFAAIQLNHEFTDVGLVQLVDEDLLEAPDPHGLLADAVVPGDPLDQAALGVLHSNCGICHGGERPPQGLSMQLRVGDEKVADTAVYDTAIGVALRNWTERPLPAEVGAGFFEQRIAPGDPRRSGIIGRMLVRGRGEQMPPIAVEEVDREGSAKVSAWISRLKPNVKPTEQRKEDDGR